MSESPRDRRLVHASQDASIATSKVVTTVFEEVLEAIHEGRLLPGQRISDVSLAQELGVSRTPVREALQRLREIGVVEASASRFTRVAVVSPRQTAQAMLVWVALYGALVDEVVPSASDEVHERMAADHEEFDDAVAALDMQAIATTNFSFFSHLVVLSDNVSLRRAIISVVHIVRLGSLHLPAYVDFAAISSAQKVLLEAVRTRDTARAHEALATLHDIRVPLEPA
jgi:DNA-binding GntR family transcriptional regulator